ncbi:ATP-grasp domain-containing protein [Streptomyces sp. VRA16 Mangrove soil]|uniref:ATP-grasp domain-containing protein n=1 Tax=Streptomyces sp. VRA16 Mangrove soil TaxID=2817434 RepID=UPI001A9DA69C|nr:ATP-grasp domain-containing protein [Streptomyces sp. VRA16 Mangrove soil]MBO1332539.1 ATP-grasp domain-containing protein [Streptomyces sp. VRA16 Mangrove soil]
MHAAHPTRTLFLSPRVTATGLALADAARRRGLGVRTYADRRTPAEWLGHPGGALYAGPLFADAVAKELGVGLLEAAPGWLADLPRELTRREVRLTSIAAARSLRRPAFMKPPNDKSFPARIYPDGSGLPGPDATDDDTPVLVSDIVTFDAEYRLFLLDGEVRTGSRYARRGQLDVAPLDTDELHDEVRDFARRLPSSTLPSAIVVDVGRLADDGGWAVVEANAAWASGHYACDADAALDVVLRAARPVDAVGHRDARFLR